MLYKHAHRSFCKCTTARTIVVMLGFLTVLLCPTLSVSNELLFCPKRVNITSASHDCPCEPGWTPTDQQIQNIFDRHSAWLSSGRSVTDIRSGPAVLCNAQISYLKVGDRDLRFSDFSNSDLGTDWPAFSNVDFSKSVLQYANFTNSDLTMVTFEGAILYGTNFENADLTATNLRSADLVRSSLAGANLAYADLTNANYVPTSQPAKHFLAHLDGLDTLYFRGPDTSFDPTGGVELRALLREAGLRTQERKLTYSIEHRRTQTLRATCPPSQWLTGRLFSSPNKPCNPLLWIDGVARFVLFGLTTRWGASPGQALLLVFTIMLIMAPVYLTAILLYMNRPHILSGIFVILPRERLIFEHPKVAAASDVCVERVSGTFCSTLVIALYFSALSSFHIGWRDLNVGTWISRMQFREYTLRGLGWVRFVSGLQSLTSVYLVALWTVTYFGRPFG